MPPHDAHRRGAPPRPRRQNFLGLSGETDRGPPPPVSSTSTASHRCVNSRSSRVGVQLGARLQKRNLHHRLPELWGTSTHAMTCGGRTPPTCMPPRGSRDVGVAATVVDDVPGKPFAKNALTQAMHRVQLGCGCLRANAVVFMDCLGLGNRESGFA